MPVNDRDLSALEHLAYRIREETYGCKPWDRQGTHVVFARELKGKHLATAIELVTTHAVDPEAKTPAAITRPFTPAPAATPRHTHPPKRRDECPNHPGQYATSCGGCAADRLAGPGYDEAEPAPTPPRTLTAGDPTTGAAACRAALHHPERTP